ncbi:hypothetical protein [Myxosarcina sp. GI1]|uniref:hypothetical protein n=1 Tax=Myxosarcina sp. GI1 TaxID=1541065 RepID=UPI00056372F1|nr:hypothetical protein [Myxosarcina sp. GI1]
MPINKSFWLLVGTVVTLVGSSLNLAAMAQYREPNDANYPSNEKDSLYGEGVTGINPMELIHRANLRNGRTPEEFQQESRGQINNSAQEFKMQQQRMLEQQRAPDTENTAQ